MEGIEATTTNTDMDIVIEDIISHNTIPYSSSLSNNTPHSNIASQTSNYKGCVKGSKNKPKVRIEAWDLLTSEEEERLESYVQICKKVSFVQTRSKRTWMDFIRLLVHSIDRFKV
ncbi:hypothetical protein OCU04_009794 [Sclerotinia nivalis]|uniref:Uncharacterized protein n=1 Tax=Sclerotinia nivalis TaxID=352851 RepID=A0A9X0DHN7_9HELO|nr:hypothetical protein OCU04_009794 [Sclerotinia nivalis]